MASSSRVTAGQQTKQTAGVQRSRQQQVDKTPALNANPPNSQKPKASSGRPAKKTKLLFMGNIAENNYSQNHNTAVKIIKLKTKEAREPSGLETPLSTSDYDLYEEKMPQDVAAAVSDRIEKWLSQIDSAEEHKWRVDEYGEDIADAFPSGETPKFARRLKKLEQNGVDSC